MSLATYAQDLKVFNNEDNYSSPLSVPVSKKQSTHANITWSGDGKWLSIAPLDHGGGPLPIFKYYNKQLQPLKYITLSNITSASFFNWTNRNIAVGNCNGEIFVWDVKDKKITTKVEYAESQPVDLISVNSDDSYIASGSLTSNKICLHSLKTNKVVNTFCIPKSKQSSSLKFCMSKKNFLGASSIESTICVWDIVKSEFEFKSLQSHSGACTDISFSPINYVVLACVSLTKTLKIFDIRERKVILDKNIGEPLTCVDIILDGDKVAMGTTGGSVIIYDLRAEKILKNFKAHDSPVLSLKTQSLKIPKSYKEVEINSPDVVDNLSKTLNISVMDAFSPIAVKDVSNGFNSKTVSFQSISNIRLNTTGSPTPYEDSFLRKVVSPLPQQKSVYLIPKSHSSPYLCTISETPQSDMSDQQTEVLSKVSKTEISNVAEGSGDGFHTDSPAERNLYYSDIVSEIRTCHKEVLNEVSLIKQELSEIKNNFEVKFKAQQENYESLKRLLMDSIKEEIVAGNTDAKIEHTCQRLLINELNDGILERDEKLNAEIRLNAFRLMHIYEMLKGTK